MEMRALSKFTVIAALAVAFIGMWFLPSTCQYLGQTSVALLGLSLITRWVVNGKRGKRNLALTMEAREKDAQQHSLRLVRNQELEPHRRRWFKRLEQHSTTIESDEAPVPPPATRTIH